MGFVMGREKNFRPISGPPLSPSTYPHLEDRAPLVGQATGGRGGLRHEGEGDGAPGEVWEVWIRVVWTQASPPE